MAHPAQFFTATFTNGQAAIVGVDGSVFKTFLIGDPITGPDEKQYYIAAITDNNHLTLHRAYLGSTVTATAVCGRHTEQWSSNAQSNTLLAQMLASLQQGFALKSDTSNAIATAATPSVPVPVVWTATPGQPILPGVRMRAASRANPTVNFQSGVLTAYDPSTGSLTLSVDSPSGSGTFADWNIGFDGGIGPTGGTFSTVTKGTLPVGNGSSVVAQAVGSNGQVLTADSTKATGVAWAALGTAAAKNTGTSGNTVPLLDGANTWSGAQTFSAVGSSYVALRNNATPGVVGWIAKLAPYAYDDAGVSLRSGYFGCYQLSAVAGAVTSKWDVVTLKANAETLVATFGAGFFTSGASGGDKGTGTINATTLYEAGTALSSKYASLAVYTVATLPAAGTARKGYRAFVSDANSTTFASTVAGGGSNNVPVYSDGSAWKIG